MKNFKLSGEELQELRLAHKAAKSMKDVRGAYKLNALILLGSDWTSEEVSEALLLDKDTLGTYVDNYKKHGITKLMSTSYKGSKPKLDDSQIEKLSAELDCNIHLTTKSVCQYVNQEFGIDYSTSGMTELLHRLGYVYKKPKIVPCNPDLDAQENFIQQFNEFMEQKPANEAVFFVDAVHPIHNSMPSYGWIKKGCIKELKTNSGRDRLNIHGAMNAETFETTVLTSDDNINTDSTINLFKYLEKIYPLAITIHVILDNAKYHYSKQVMEYVKESRINLVFLPPYSPELNLIERLWKVFKKNVLYNKFYPTVKEFKEACLKFFKNQEEHAQEIESIMGEGLLAFA